MRGHEEAEVALNMFLKLMDLWAAKDPVEITAFKRKRNPYGCV
jgi:hypothetical protein